MNASCQKVLNALKDGPKTTGELTDLYSARYGARIKDLRDMGYLIRSEKVRQGSWRYTLDGWKEPARVIPIPVDSQDAREYEDQQEPAWDSVEFCWVCAFHGDHDGPCLAASFRIGPPATAEAIRDAA